jgi:lipopolysaccharide transport system permease protein
MTAHSRRAAAEPSPSVVISPSRGRLSFNLGELWAHRELIYFLVWRDLTVRYRQTVFGVLWAIVQPLALMAVFALFLGRLGGIAPENVSYPVFVFVGLVPWMFISKGVTAASESLVGASSLLQKVYFPRLVVPIAAVCAQIPDFLVTAIVLAGVLVLSGFAPTSALAVIPVSLGIGFGLCLGLGSWLSALNVRFRDIRQVIPLAVQLWLFASPIAYASSIVPKEGRWLYDLNPMVGIIDSFRWALLGGDAPILSVALAAVTSAIVFFSGLIYFRRVERTFADVI